MTDTDLINEIIHKLKANNAGHFDRDNLLDSLDKLDFHMMDEHKVKEEAKEELEGLKDEIQDIIDRLEELV